MCGSCLGYMLEYFARRDEVSLNKQNQTNRKGKGDDKGR